MSKIAFLCPGYTSEVVGMGVDFVGRASWGADYFEEVKAICGLDIFDMCMNGPQEELSQTQNAQPALAATSIAIARALRERGVEPAAVAGIGEGEYAAHVIAGTVDMNSAFELVARRGALTAMAAHINGGKTAEFLGCTKEQADQLCASFGGKIAVCAELSPSRMAISGDAEALEAAVAQWREGKGSVKVCDGDVAFNGKLMRSVSTGMGMALKNTLFGPGEVPVYCNLTGARFDHMRSPELLGEQVTSPVLWRQTIEAMLKDGVDTFIQCGPGSTALDAARETAQALGADVAFYKVATAEDVMFAKL